QHLPKWVTGLKKLHFCCTESPSGVTRSLRSLGQLKTKISPDLLCNTSLSQPQG
ncbi:Uncharacterized protein FWK35_00030203, partial [Aphis craccivora]